MKKITIIILCLAILLTLTNCKKEETDNIANESASSLEVVAVSEKIDTSSLFSSRDKEIGYDVNTAIAINLKTDTAECTSSSVLINASTVTIKAEGTYLLTGELNSGQIIIDATKEDKIQIVLNGVNINCNSSAAIYIKNADKVFITLATDTQNTLSNKSEFVAIDENNIDAVIYSKEDLTINGLGFLTINAAFGSGVVSKDSLVLASGIYKINAAEHGFISKDSIAIADGNYTIISGKDGIHSENKDDATLGLLYIAAGTFTLTAENDGLYATATLQIDGGNYIITTGGGSVNASTDTSENERPGWGMEASQSTSTNTISAKGIKASGNLVISAGDFIIDSSDDAIHSNTNLTIDGGDFTISSGDDGLHADTSTVINNGTMNINKSYEGIEGQSVTISGGVINITSSDDGINAAGGNDSSAVNGRPGMGNFNANADCFIKIMGGKISVNASGDGIDANGAIYVSGGETYVSGSKNSGNGALDYDGIAQITGGVFVAMGASGMAQNFGNTSTQGAILCATQTTTSEAISLKNSEGTELISYIPPKSYNCVVVSCPEILQNQTYSLLMGTDSQNITMTDIIYSIGAGGMEVPGGGGGKPQGGR